MSKIPSIIARRIVFNTVLGIIVLLTACQKGRMIDNYPSVDYYNIIPSFVNFWSIDTFKRENRTIEAGIIFHAKFDGALTYLACRVPDSNLNVRLSIWEYDTGKRLRLTTIKVDSANQVYGTKIDDVRIEKSKKYVLSINTNAWFFYHNLSETNGVPYPFDYNQLVIDGFVVDSISGGTVMPRDTSNFYYMGDMGFSFRRAGAEFK